MNLDIKMVDHTGHTELQVRDGQATLEWKSTSMKERKGLRELIEKAREKGFKTFSVGDDGEAEEMTDKVPGVFFNRAGKIILKGDNANLKALALGVLESELKNYRLIMELQDDNTWEFKKIEELELDAKDAKGKAKKVMTTEKAAGG